MATNKALKDALLAKLGITPQALSQRVRGKKRQLPCTTEEAVYLIAFDQEIPIDKFLSKEELTSIRQLPGLAARAPVDSAPKGRRKTCAPNSSGAIEIRFPNEFKATDPLLSKSKLDEAKAMAGVYPLLYVLENSMRELIKRIMRKNHGEDWWETQIVNSQLNSVKKKAADRMKTETKNSWHQKRGSHPIDYVELKDLETIFRAKKILFHPAIISDWDWFMNFLKELYPSRNVVCHMNPLLPDNVDDVKLEIKRWERVVKSAMNAIPD